MQNSGHIQVSSITKADFDAKRREWRGFMASKGDDRFISQDKFLATLLETFYEQMASRRAVTSQPETAYVAEAEARKEWDEVAG